MWTPDWLLKLIGKKVSDKIGLQEGTMEDTKKWWTSKGVWTGVVTFLLGAYSLVSVTVMPALGKPPLPPIPDWVLTLLGAMGVYSRVIAEKTIA